MAETTRFNDDAVVSGLRTVGRYTLQFNRPPRSAGPVAMTDMPRPWPPGHRPPVLAQDWWQPVDIDTVQQAGIGTVIAAVSVRHSGVPLETPMRLNPRFPVRFTQQAACAVLPQLPRRGLAAAALAACAVLAGCDRTGPAQPPVPKADVATNSTVNSSNSNSNTAGVLPHTDSSLPASDRPGALAVGALEAGQAGSRGSSGVAAPTAGDGAASAQRPASGG